MKHNENNRTATLHRYTIVEMMMVTAIFLIILSMAIAAWLNSGSQTKLRSAVRLVNAQLNLARAKAVAERRWVGVYFPQSTGDGKEYHGYACRLYYYSGTTDEPAKDKALPGEDWVVLPSGTVLSQAEPGNYSTSLSVPDAVVFDAKGRLVHFSESPVANRTDAAKLYVVVGEQAQYGSLKLKDVKDDSYFLIEINPFSGRATTTFHANEN